MSKKQKNSMPTRKVMGGSLATALSILVIFLFEKSFGQPLPEGVREAVGVVIGFVVAYMVPPAPNDEIVDI